MATRAPKPTVALLMFTCNDLDQALLRIETVRDQVDEIVVIDSSEPMHLGPRRRHFEDLSVRIHRALPTGYVDLLRPYGVSRVSSEWTLLLETDEEPSPGLMARLSTPGEMDAYWVPRYEQQLRGTTRHLRLFRTRAYAPGAEAYGHPQIRGRIGGLAPGEFLVHHRDFGRYLEGRDRSRRLLTIESYERPFTGRMARQLLTFRGRGSETLWPGSRLLAARLDEELSGPASHLVLWLEFLRSVATTGNLRLARFDRSYGLARWRFLQHLTTADRTLRLEIARELRRGGGMLRYLGFEDFGYVERLTAEFGWDRTGSEVLETLLHFRHEQGHPMPHFSA
jgi:hypothetical protein